MNNFYIDKFKKYLSVERNYSLNTLDAYIREVNLLGSKYKDISVLSSDDLKKYIKSFKHLSFKTISRKISVLKTFYAYLLREEIIIENPALDLISPKIDKTLPDVLNLSEVSLLLDIDVKNAYNARDKAILELLYSSGLRVSELIDLELQNIDLDLCIVRVMGKGRKERIVPLGDYAIDALSIYLNNYRKDLNKKNNNYVFLNKSGTKISRQFIFKTIKKECLVKGITKSISPHTLRHTFASHLLQNGADLRIIQEMLGHENLSTTQVYTHISNEKLKEEYKDTHPRS